MKRVLVTQRVDFHTSHGERRDAIDQRWIHLLRDCELWPVLVPNHPEYVQDLVRHESFDGVLLTGGNTLSSYGGDAPERDASETLLLDWALKQHQPVLGVCRGMQLLQSHFGIELESVSGHVRTRHKLTITPGCRLSAQLSELQTVNAFHDFGAKTSRTPLVISARSEDDVVMAVEHQDRPFYGQMWHSERETPFVEEEKNILKSIFHERV